MEREIAQYRFSNIKAFKVFCESLFIRVNIFISVFFFSFVAADVPH